MRPRASGSPGSTCSTPSSTSRTICEEGIRSWATRFGERGVFVGARALPRRGRCAPRRRRGRPRKRRLLLARCRSRSRACSLYEHALVRPGDLERLDAAFFTVNGVISGRLLRLRRPGHADSDGRYRGRQRQEHARSIVGDGLEKRYGRKRVLRGVSFDLPRGGFLVVTGANGVGQDDAAATRGRPRRADKRHRSRSKASAAISASSGHEPLALPGADGAREPRALRPPLSRSRAPRAERDAARAVRPLGCALRSRLDLLARDDPAARALPRAPPRSGPARARRAVHGARRGRRRRCSTPSSRRSRASGRSLLSTHDPARVAALATDRLVLA